MIKQKQIIYLISVMLVVLSFFSALGFVLSRQQVIKYVYADRVFEEFIMTKQLKGQLENKLNNEKQEIDSIELVLNYIISSRLFDNNTVRDAQLEFDLIKEKYRTNNQELSLKYDNQILSRLKQYLSEYLAIQGYSFIISIEPDALMKGREEDNITNDFIEFINRRYEGGK